MKPESMTGLSALLALVVGWAVLVKPAGPVQTDDVKGAGRDRWQMPNEVLAVLDLKKGDVVADIGAGTGYFTLHFARSVGPEGKVYAVDIAAHLLGYLKKEARQQNLTNVTTILSREDDPLLPQGSLDLAFFCDTIHEIPARVNFYRKVRLALKRNGRMAIVDSLFLAHGEDEASHDLAVREAEQAGFRLVKEPKFLPRQYFLVFERVEETASP